MVAQFNGSRELCFDAATFEQRASFASVSPALEVTGASLDLETQSGEDVVVMQAIDRVNGVDGFDEDGATKDAVADEEDEDEEFEVGVSSADEKYVALLNETGYIKVFRVADWCCIWRGLKMQPKDEMPREKFILVEEGLFMVAFEFAHNIYAFMPS